MLLEASTLYMEGAIEDGLPYLRPVPAAEDPRLSPESHVVETLHFTVGVTVKAYA